MRNIILLLLGCEVLLHFITRALGDALVLDHLTACGIQIQMLSHFLQLVFYFEIRLVDFIPFLVDAFF